VNAKLETFADESRDKQKLAQTLVLDAARPAKPAAFDAVGTAKDGEFAPLRIGGRIGAYDVLDNLAEGGMGAVFRVKDEGERELALKAPLPDGRGGTFAHRMRRFLREVRLTSRMDHPGVAKVVAVGQEEGLPYFTMELVDGASMADRIWEGPMDLDEATRVIEGAARAVHHIHEKGVIHRDLKPQNILVKPSGEVVIIDFGLARDAAGIDPRITQSGVWLGTPAYIAPEQAQGEASKVDARADVYSLCAVLYEAIVGVPPFGTGNARTIFKSLKTRNVVSVRVVRPDCPEALDRAILKGLSKEREGRFATALELASALAEARREIDPARAKSALSTGELSLLDGILPFDTRGAKEPQASRAQTPAPKAARKPSSASTHAPTRPSDGAKKASSARWNSLSTSNANKALAEGAETPRARRPSSERRRAVSVDHTKKLSPEGPSTLLVLGGPALLAVFGLLLLIL
jgi:serine/threonine protein kinase